MASRQGKITQAGFYQGTTRGGKGPEKPSLALENEKVKTEPEDKQDTKTAQTYKNTQSKLKQLSKQMGDLAREGSRRGSTKARSTCNPSWNC